MSLHSHPIKAAFIAINRGETARLAAAIAAKLPAAIKPKTHRHVIALRCLTNSEVDGFGNLTTHANLTIGGIYQGVPVDGYWPPRHFFVRIDGGGFDLCPSSMFVPVNAARAYLFPRRRRVAT